VNPFPRPHDPEKWNPVFGKDHAQEKPLASGFPARQWCAMKRRRIAGIRIPGQHSRSAFGLMSHVEEQSRQFL
jgi:hypothetical protein